MSGHWTTKYLGTPFIIGARGPKFFDCWGLVREIYRREKNISLAEFPGVSARDEALYAVAMKAERERNWQELEIPEDFCIVCMGRAGENFFHVGVWVAVDGKGMVLHTREKINAVLDSLKQLMARGIQIKKFYRHKKCSG